MGLRAIFSTQDHRPTRTQHLASHAWPAGIDAVHLRERRFPRATSKVSTRALHDGHNPTSGRVSLVLTIVSSYLHLQSAKVLARYFDRVVSLWRARTDFARPPVLGGSRRDGCGDHRRVRAGFPHCVSLRHACSLAFQRRISFIHCRSWY